MSQLRILIGVEEFTHRRTSTLYRLHTGKLCCQLMLMVRLPCGSVSTSRTFLPSIASPMPRFSQVVVLPVPPFWLTMAIVVAFFEIFITSDSLSRGWFGSGRKAAWWWARCTEKRADIVSCYGSGCCSLQSTSAQSGCGRRSTS